MDAVNHDGNNQSPGTRKRAGVRRQVKHALRIDMTPMVDLGFLLITFFVITTEMSKPTAMNLIMPKDGPPIDLGESDALTVLLGANNTAWYYEGDWMQAVKNGKVLPLEGKLAARQLLIDKQQKLENSGRPEGRNGLMLLVKPGSGTSYKELVDLLDEVSINDVKKYAVVKLSDEEALFIRVEERRNGKYLAN